MKPFVSFPPLVIRPASPDDAALLRLIYAPYIQETAITFEKTVPSLKEFRERIVHTLQQYPYLVCEENQEVRDMPTWRLIPDLLTATVCRNPAST